jgi:hypothetical protein
MSRWNSGANATAAAQASVGMVTLCDLDFASGTLYLHDSGGTLSFGGHSYLGVGVYGTIDVVAEDLENVPRGLKVTLSGVEPGLVTTAMQENYQGRRVTIYVGLLDPNSMVFAAPPESVWEGRMDYMQIEIAQNSGTITLNCEHRLQREPLVARYTQQDQNIAHPGDNFFDLLAQIPMTTASWGKTTVTHPENTLPGNGGYRGGGGRGGGGQGGGNRF